jgi:hypothetical protein
MYPHPLIHFCGGQPLTFTGKLAKVTLSIDRPKPTPADEKRRKQAAGRD